MHTGCVGVKGSVMKTGYSGDSCAGDHDLAGIESEIGLASQELLGEFRITCTRLKRLLSPGELRTWAEWGVALARLEPPLSHETAAEYFRSTPGVLDSLPRARLVDWASRGRSLCHDSPRLASAYFRASPRALALLPGRLVDVWLALGPGLYGGNARSIGLACSFVDAAPDLLGSLSLVRLERFLLFLRRLAESSYEVAEQCLSRADEVFKYVTEDTRGPFLAVALVLARLHPEAAATHFIAGPKALTRVAAGQRRRFLALMEKIAGRNARLSLAFLFECSQVLGRIDWSLHSLVLNWTETVVGISSAAGIECLKSSPAVLARIGVVGLERWLREGASVVRADEEAGRAYFRLEMPGTGGLERLLARVELDQAREVLLMYAQALAGTPLEIRPAGSPVESVAGWAPDGTTILLPSSMDRFASEEDNYAWYKVAVTHQAGHVEFGTFGFSFEREAALFPERRRTLSGNGDGLSDTERLLSLFQDRRLGADLFRMTEDARIDFLVKRAYPGIRARYEWVQRESVFDRPSLFSLPLREAFVEILTRMSLDGKLPVLPEGMGRPFEAALDILRRVQSPKATVEDSAEAAIRLYDIVSAIPNEYVPEWEPDAPDSDDSKPGSADRPPGGEGGGEAVFEPGGEVPYQGAAEVSFRSGFHPEMLNLVPDPKAGPEPAGSSPVAPPGGEVRLSRVVQGGGASSGLYASNLPAAASGEESSSDDPDHADERRDGDGWPRPDGPERCYLYDEWDYQAGLYRPAWCTVREKVLPEGGADFFERALADNPGVAMRIRRHFEAMAPERLRKTNLLYDGEDLDLDAVVRSVVERKAGRTTDGRVYWKRRKAERNVAAVLLLDMSASTSTIIRDAADEYPDWYLDLLEGVPRPGVRQTDLPGRPSRRVVDVVRETVVLMMNAFEVIGDAYGVYGFSGHGRENVEVLVVKGIDEAFTPAVKRRVGRIAPLHGTRMGPAIRHAAARLEAQEARTKLLVLVSDGYPQDEGYGEGGFEKEYALEDTRMAFREARRKQILPFCLTVDLAGHNYLARISPDVDYEVVNEVEALPERLPLVYRRLTT